MIINNAVRNIMVVGKEFCKFMDGNFGRSIACKEANTYLESLSIPVRTKSCPFHDESGPAGY